MAIEIGGKEYRELRSDEDVITVKGHRIRWNNKQGRYTIRKDGRQIYDTEYYDDAIRFVVGE